MEELTKEQSEHIKNLDVLRLGSADYVLTHLKILDVLLFGENGKARESKDSREVFEFMRRLAEDAFYHPFPGHPQLMTRPQIIWTFEEYIKLRTEMQMLKPVDLDDFKEKAPYK